MNLRINAWLERWGLNWEYRPEIRMLAYTGFLLLLAALCGII